MTNLLTINNVVFPDAEGGFDITYKDKVNEYESESGEKTVEVIRKGVCNISTSYVGLTESQLKSLTAAIQVVNTVKYYNPLSGVVETKTMKASSDRVKISKKYYKNNISVWSLDLDLEEM